MRNTNSGMWAYAIDPEFRQRTHCGPYWYLVHAGAFSHTAFITRRGLNLWMDERGLKLENELPAQATHGASRIVGEYREAMHMDYNHFHALIPIIETRALSNGEWTLAKITQDADGLRTVHTLNPNMRARQVFEYHATSAIYK